MKIHSTAIVDSGAQLAEDVEVGPYAIVGPEAVIGSGTNIRAYVLIEGSVTIGTGNVIGPAAMIGGAPQDLSFSSKTRSAVRIGNDNVIREYCSIHRGTTEGSATQIGNKNLLMVGAHVGHNCDIGNNVVIANNCLLAGYVSVHDNAFLGGGCAFHQYMRVGRLAMIQGASAFGKDIPPFVIAAERNFIFGLNVIGMRRAGFSAKERDEIKAAFRLIYTSGLNLTQALDKAAGMNLTGPAREFIDFIVAAKKRGICPYKGDEDIPLR